MWFTTSEFSCRFIRAYVKVCLNGYRVLRPGMIHLSRTLAPLVNDGYIRLYGAAHLRGQLYSIFDAALLQAVEGSVGPSETCNRFHKCRLTQETQLIYRR